MSGRLLVREERRQFVGFKGRFYIQIHDPHAPKHRLKEGIEAEGYQTELGQIERA